MEQDNKEQVDEGSPLKKGSDDVVGAADQIVKVDIKTDDCQSPCYLCVSSQGDRRDWSLAAGEKSDCLPGLHTRPGTDISHSFPPP